MRRGGRCSRRRGRPPGSACEGGFWPTGCRCVALGGGWGAGAAGFFRSCASPSASPPPSLPVASVRAGGLVGGRVGGGSRAVGSSSHFGSTRVPAQPSLHGRAGWPQPAAGPRPPSLFLTRGRVPLTGVWFGGGGGERRWRARRALWPSGDARRPAHGESGDGGRWGRPAAAGRVPAGARFRGTLSAGDGARDARVGARLWWRHRPRPRLPVGPVWGRRRPGGSDDGLPAGRAAAAQWPRRHAPARPADCPLLLFCGRPPGGFRLGSHAAAATRRLFIGIVHCRRGGTAAGGSRWMGPPQPLPSPPPRRRGVVCGRHTRPSSRCSCARWPAPSHVASFFGVGATARHPLLGCPRQQLTNRSRCGLCPRHSTHGSPPAGGAIPIGALAPTALVSAARPRGDPRLRRIRGRGGKTVEILRRGAGRPKRPRLAAPLPRRAAAGWRERSPPRRDPHPPTRH